MGEANQREQDIGRANGLLTPLSIIGGEIEEIKQKLKDNETPSDTTES